MRKSICLFFSRYYFCHVSRLMTILCRTCKLILCTIINLVKWRDVWLNSIKTTLIKLILKYNFKLTRSSCAALAEWLRRWTWNPMGSPRVGSNPAGSVPFFEWNKFHTIFRCCKLEQAHAHLPIFFVYSIRKEQLRREHPNHIKV